MKQVSKEELEHCTLESLGNIDRNAQAAGCRGRRGGGEGQTARPGHPDWPPNDGVPQALTTGKKASGRSYAFPILAFPVAIT